MIIRLESVYCSLTGLNTSFVMLAMDPFTALGSLGLFLCLVGLGCGTLIEGSFPLILCFCISAEYLLLPFVFLLFGRYPSGVVV